MLKGIDPILNADILYILRAMGHGDELAIVDVNFPAETMARKLVRMEAADAPRMLRAVLSLLPLDDFVPDPAIRMEVVGDPEAEPEVCREFRDILAQPQHGGVPLAKIDRFAFYERVRGCFAVIATGERRLYGNVILKKGVIRPQ